MKCVLCDKKGTTMYFGKKLCKKHWEELSGMELKELDDV